VKVAESGICENSELTFVDSLGFDAALIGTGLMRNGEPGQALAKLLLRGSI
jgi:indole-3-glycerol phosphate synthase